MSGRRADRQREPGRACYWCAVGFDFNLARSMSSFASNRNSWRRPVPRRQTRPIFRAASWLSNGRVTRFVPTTGPASGGDFYPVGRSRNAMSADAADAWPCTTLHLNFNTFHTSAPPSVEFKLTPEGAILPPSSHSLPNGFSGKIYRHQVVDIVGYVSSRSGVLRTWGAVSSTTTDNVDASPRRQSAFCR